MIKFFSKFMVIMYNNFLKATLSIIIAITVPFVACTSGICCYAGVTNFNVLNLVGFWYHFFCTNLLSDLPSAKPIVFLFVYQLYIRDASKNWKLVGSDGGCQLLTKEPAANVVLMDYISSEKWQDVVDFDDHLDDISKYVLLINVYIIFQITIKMAKPHCIKFV